MKRDTLEEVTSLEQLDSVMKIVSVRTWIPLLFFAVVVILSLIWGFLGTIPVIVDGKSIVLDSASTVAVETQQEGVVSRVLVEGGAKVALGDPLIVIGEAEVLRAPFQGSVLWINVMEGDAVAAGQPLLLIQGCASPKSMKIFAFVSLEQGQKLKPGMHVKTTLEAVDSGLYGMLLGEVRQIFPYPVSASDFYMQKIPSPALRAYLTEGDEPRLLVEIDPELDLENPLGLKWSSRVGPPEPVMLGSLGVSLILCEELRPIDYVMPSLKKGK